MEMLKTDILIIGVGVGGLAAGSWLTKYEFDNFMVFDKNEEVPKNLHNGVHYLHTEPELPFDFELKEVTLTDGILDRKLNGNPVIKDKADLLDMLIYSEKVREIQHPSSIMEIGKRPHVYLPESNNLNDMIEAMEDFIEPHHFMMGWELIKIIPEDKMAIFSKGEENLGVKYKHCINTSPLDKVLPYFKIKKELEAFPVHITNFKVEKIVPNWMINLYIANKDTPMYRASVLNGICSVESVKPLSAREISSAINFLNVFHIYGDSLSYTWETGKVKSISTDERSDITEMFKKEEFYSIGRFGLWNRQLLVDSTIWQAKHVVLYLADCTKWDELKKKLVL